MAEQFIGGPGGGPIGEGPIGDVGTDFPSLWQPRTCLETASYSSNTPRFVGAESVYVFDVPVNAVLYVLPLFATSDRYVVEPNWNTVVFQAQRNQTVNRLRFTNPAPAGARLYVLVRSESMQPSGREYVLEGQLSAGVPVDQHYAPYVVLAMPSWPTSLKITRTLTGFTADFGAPCPGPLDWVDWIAVSEFTTLHVSPPADAGFVSVAPTLPAPYAVFASIDWQGPHLVTRADNLAAELAFANMAPFGSNVWFVLRPTSLRGGAVVCGEAASWQPVTGGF